MGERLIRTVDPKNGLRSQYKEYHKRKSWYPDYQKNFLQRTVEMVVRQVEDQGRISSDPDLPIEQHLEVMGKGVGTQPHWEL